MAQNIVIAGNRWNDVPSVEFDKYGGGTAQFYDTTIASNAAAASDINSGKLAWVNGNLIVGTGSGGGGTGGVIQDQDGFIVLDDQGGGTAITSLNVTQNGTYTAPSGQAYNPVTVNVSGGSMNLKIGVIRPDAELVKTWHSDDLLVTDLGIQIPSYGTSSKTIRSASVYSETATLDFDNYFYYVVQRNLVIPIYTTQPSSTPRQDYASASGIAEIIHFTPIKTTRGDDVNIPSTYNNKIQTSNVSRYVFYNSSNNATIYTSSAYGIYASNYAPSLSNNTLTIKSCTIYARGDSSYMSSVAWGYLSDARVQHIAKLYRVPVGTTSLEGWEHGSQLLSISNDVTNNNCDLT